MSETGTNERFELLFQKQEKNNVLTVENEVLVFSNQEVLHVLSSKEKIKSIAILIL